MRQAATTQTVNSHHPRYDFSEIDMHGKHTGDGYGKNNGCDRLLALRGLKEWNPRAVCPRGCLPLRQDAGTSADHSSVPTIPIQTPRESTIRSDTAVVGHIRLRQTLTEGSRGIHLLKAHVYAAFVLSFGQVYNLLHKNLDRK